MKTETEKKKVDSAKKFRIYKQCVHCGKRFRTRRAERRYCSDACKQAAYRKRRALHL